MSDDPCLTCPLPACNEKDPRCGWRQTPEFLRIQALKQAQKKRSWQRQLRKRRGEEYVEKNREELTRRARLDRCKILWGSGHDTSEIAARLGVAESLVYNELLQRKSA